MRSFVVIALLAASATAGSTRIPIDLGRDHWTAFAPGAKSVGGKYDARLVHKRWTAKVTLWPTSRVFVQTPEQQLESLRKRDPDIAVLQQEQRAPHDWVVVVESHGKIVGTVLRPGHGDNAMCTFESDAKSYQAPLAACRSLEHAGRLPHS